MKTLLALVLPLFLFAQTVLHFESEGKKIVVKQLASELGVPWGMTFVDENQLLLAIKDGSFILLDTQSGTKRVLKAKVDVLLRGQGGLLDIQTSPHFKSDRTLYFTYVKSIDNQGATTLAKARFESGELNDIEDIFITQSQSDTSRHFGSRITFDEQGHIFFGVGDRGVRPNGQDLLTHAGSILRLNLDGSVPKDNPFVKDSRALPEIYSYGHRNPQGLYFDKLSQRLIEGEHGPRGGDEINIIQKGANYGWATISYGKEYWNPLPVGEGTHSKGMEQPIKVYIPSIAPGSLIVYQGEANSSFRGNVFQGALKLTHLNRLVLDDKDNVIKEERWLEDMHERIRNVIEDNSGNLLISTDSGNIYQLILK